MKIQDILLEKGNRCHTIDPESRLSDVAKTLVKHNCGSLLVLEESRLVGIITERDMLRACAGDARPLEAIRVREKMTGQLVVGRPEDEVEDIMGLMTHHRIRHLPILREEQLVGIISIGDVVKAHHDHLSLENAYLKHYIHG